MRVLHVVPSVSVKYGGPSNVPGLVAALNRHGVDATLLTTDIEPDGRLTVPVGQPVLERGAPHIYHHAWRAGGRWALAPSMAGTLRRMVPAADLVHVHWLYNFPCVAAARAAHHAGVPFVVHPRGSLDPYMLTTSTRLKRLYLDTIGRPLLRQASAVVFTAEQERAVARYAPRRTEWVIPNGLDMAPYATLPPRGTFRAAYPQLTGPFLLFLGRLSRQKGLDVLLPAFKRVRHRRPDLTLVLAGPDHEGYESYVRSLVHDLDLREHVLFTGTLAGRDKLAAFVDADLFVLTSRSENFGGAIIEALACGLPVLISDQVNIHRELAADDAATVVPCTVEHVEAGLDAALADPGARARMAVRGPAIVRARYAWDAVAPLFVARYTELLRSRRAA